MRDGEGSSSLQNANAPGRGPAGIEDAVRQPLETWLLWRELSLTAMAAAGLRMSDAEQFFVQTQNSSPSRSASMAKGKGKGKDLWGPGSVPRAS